MINLLISLIIPMAAATETCCQNNQKDKMIIVTGAAEKEVKPNLARWAGTFKVVTTKADSVTGEMEKARNKVLQFLESSGIEATSLQFQPPQVNVIRDTKTPNLERFEAEQTFRVQSPDIDKVTKLAHESFNLFGKDIEFSPGNVIYDVKDTTAIEQELLDLALKNARAKAQALANAAGAKLGRVLNVQEGGRHGSPRPLMAAAPRSAGLSPVDTAGIMRQESAHVSVTFAIE